jgi:hypothetical protein
MSGVLLVPQRLPSADDGSSLERFLLGRSWKTSSVSLFEPRHVDILSKVRSDVIEVHTKRLGADFVTENI